MIPRNTSLSGIRSFVLGEDSETKQELRKVDEYLRKELSLTHSGSERRLEILFYSLVTKLRLFNIETLEMETLFRMFFDEMHRQIANVTHGYSGETTEEGSIKTPDLFTRLKRRINTIDRRLNVLRDKIHHNQTKAFLYVCEQYVHTLERHYKDMSMSHRVLEVYTVRMDIERNWFFLNREFGLYIGFSIFKAISNYGTSFVRLATTCGLSIILFASIYWFADYFAPENLRMISHLTDYSSYFFNSLVTITGLGIDASPQTALQRVAMGINAIYGMVVFGMLFNVISTKLSMNS